MTKALTPSTSRTVRLALELARERGDISYPTFHSAMVEVTGTDDRSKWQGQPLPEERA